jgi:hypothetical protein
MALWINTATQDYDLYTILYLLGDALKSALNDACFLESAAPPKADVKGAGHAEIAARLGRFRDSCRTFQEREALMLTKLLRARNWAIHLRKLAPETQQDVDQFIDGTEFCEQMKGDFLKDAQRMFHGGGSLSRFVSQRMPEPRKGQAESGPYTPPDKQYLVGGRMALSELRAACEVFLGQLETEFFSSGVEDSAPLPDPIMARLEAPPEEKPALVPELHS